MLSMLASVPLQHDSNPSALTLCTSTRSKNYLMARPHSDASKGFDVLLVVCWIAHRQHDSDLRYLSTTTDPERPETLPICHLTKSLRQCSFQSVSGILKRMKRMHFLISYLTMVWTSLKILFRCISTTALISPKSHIYNTTWNVAIL